MYRAGHLSTHRLVPLFLLLAFPGSLAAQAVLIGRTISDSTKDPISGVEVVLEKPATRVETDTDGQFTVANIPWGIQTALLRKIGYRPVRLRLIVAGNDTISVDVRLERSAVELEPVVVTASTVRPGMEEFAHRRLAGFGRFFDSRDLRQVEHRRLSNLLEGVAGVRVLSRGFRAVLVSSRSNCPMAVWLDGVRLYSPGARQPTVDINEFWISQLEGIEVYRGAADTPVELTGPGGGSECGTVALWTRRG